MLHGFDPSFLCLGGEQHIKSRAAPTDTYKQTKQKDLTVFTDRENTIQEKIHVNNLFYYILDINRDAEECQLGSV